MAYATPAAFVALFGQSWLNEYLGRLDDAGQTAFISSGLDAASQLIDASLAKARYPSPITAGLIAPEQSAGVLALLSQYACYLAVEPIGAGATDLPAGPKSCLEAAKSWLKGLEAGAQRIAGVDKSAAEVALIAAGSILFLPDGRGPAFPECQSAAASRLLW